MFLSFLFLFLGDEEKGYADREDVHKPATNISEKKHSDKVKHLIKN